MFARAAAIIILGFIAYGAMLPAPFRIMDDRASIVENQALKSAHNIPALFKEGYFQDQTYYRPLVNLSFMGEYRAFGLNSFFYNLDNLILHILNALLVFLLVWRLTNNSATGFWTGLLFVIHPVQWEAVCNVPGRAILLSAFFVLTSFILFLEYYKNRRFIYLPFMGIVFSLGLLSKESAGILPLVLTAYLAGDKTKPWVEKFKCLWSFAAGIAGYLLLRGCLGMTDFHHSSGGGAFVLGFLTFLRSVITDLRLLIWPVDLHFDRCLPLMTSFTQPEALVTCFFWMAALITFCFSYRKIHPFIVFLILWFFTELLPVSQLVAGIEVGAGRISTAEHFLYLACIPVLTGMVLVFRWCYEQNARKFFVNPFILKVIASSFLFFLLFTAVGQSKYASTEWGMISRSLDFEPDNPRLWEDLGIISVLKNDIPGAERYFRAAAKADSYNPSYHIRLGTSLCQQGKFIEGLEQFVAFDPGLEKSSVERQEKLTMAHILEQLSQGKTFDARGWLAIGIYDVRFHQDRQAIDAFLNSSRLNPLQTDAWFNLGSLYEARQSWVEAAKAYKKLLGLHDLTPFQKDFGTRHLVTVTTQNQATQQGY